MYLNLFIMCLVIVFIIDISGIVDTVKRQAWKWIYKGAKEYREFSAKPFDCSLCSTWWAGIIYLCFTSFTWVNIGYVAMLALFTPIFKDIMILAKDFSMKIIDVIYEFFGL